MPPTPRPEDLVTIKGARIQSIHLDEDNLHHWRSPYFTIEAGGKTYRIRANYDEKDRKEFAAWVHGRKNKNDLVDITVFLYRWRAGEQSGVVNFFHSGTICKGES
jgi:hypothetical protein